MGVAEDLREIGDRGRRNLIAVHDFFSHSKKVWGSFAGFVEQGHTVSETSAATGTTVDQNDLVRLAPDYARLYLATFTFKQFVATFEVFFFDLFHRVWRHKPWQFNELRHDQPREWFEGLNKAVRLDCPREDEIDSLVEIKATRELLEHNAGVVNDVYLRKAGKKARFPLGELVEIDGPYHLASWSLLKKLVDDLTSAAIARLASPSP
jgi:hypothetical protein